MKNRISKKVVYVLMSLGIFSPSVIFAVKPGEQLSNFANKGGYDVTQASLAQRVGDILAVAYSVLGVAALLLIIYAGFNWMLAQGNQDKIQESKRIIRNAVIGLAILLGAYSLTAFVVAALTS